MKRKSLIFILTAFVLCLIFALAGCSDNTPNGGDLPEDTTPYYTVTFDSQGGSNVESQKVRQGNPVVSPDAPKRENYSFIGWYKSADEDAVEWKFATDRVNEDVTLYAKWQSSDVQTPTANLTFEHKGNAYVVTGASGQEEKIIIPAEYNGLPVIEIGESAFAYSKHTSDITYVSIPDSITTIGLNAFHNRSELVTIDISGTSSLTSIGRNAFSGNGALKAIYIPQGVTEIGDSAFNNCGSLESISVATANSVYSGEGNNLIEKATDTLIRGSNKSVIPSTVTTIAQAAFRRANGITTVNIPVSVTAIGNYFIADSAITEINYAGSEEQWNAIEKSATMWNYGNRNVMLKFGTPSTPNQPVESADGILIVYFSYSGNTERVAKEIISQSNGDGVEIVPSIPYTAEDTNYNDSNSRSQVERRTDARPEISNQTYSQIDMTDYSTVIIGYPIWNGYEPMIIRAFIEHYNGLSGKTVYTFSTASSSSGNTAYNSIKSRCPNAEVKDNLHFTSGTLLNMQTSISEWLTRNNLKQENTVQSNTVYITIGNKVLTATLVENSATEALKERLKTAPITINMSDYGGFEKVGGFGFSLPTRNEQITTQPCEFVLYQGNQLVIFYGSNSWSYTRLGKIDNITQAELKEILGTGNVTITLSLQVFE